MIITKWLITCAVLLLTATAHAHAHLVDSDPHDGAAGKAPERIVLTFSESARLTAVTLQRAGAEAQKLAPLPTAMAPRVTLPLPKLLPGSYTLTWRVVGDDGHITSGALLFKVVDSPATGSDPARGRGGG